MSSVRETLRGGSKPVLSNPQNQSLLPYQETYSSSRLPDMPTVGSSLHWTRPGSRGTSSPRRPRTGGAYSALIAQSSLKPQTKRFTSS